MDGEVVFARVTGHDCMRRTWVYCVYMAISVCVVTYIPTDVRWFKIHFGETPELIKQIFIELYLQTHYMIDRNTVNNLSFTHKHPNSTTSLGASRRLPFVRERYIY